MNDLAAYHREVVERLQEILGDALVGVYVGGSYALGGYAPERSDLDVAAVSRRPVPARTKRTIAEALRQESLSCPGRGLEFVLYPESTVREPTGEAGYELNLNTGRALPFHLSLNPAGADGHWYAIDRAILREHGVVLVGPPARELFAPIPREILLARLVDSVRWYEGHEGRGDDAVLTACQARRYAAEGAWSSKVAAGEWACARPDDGDLVSRALAARAGGRPLDPAKVGHFLAETRRLLGDRP